MQISQDIRNQFKKPVEIYKEIIDHCTDLNINIFILNRDLDLRYTRYTSLSPTELAKTNAVDPYFNKNPDFFPIISKIIQVFVTLSVPTVTGARSFSSLRRLKTYLKNSTGQNRLNSLALLNIHRDVNVKMYGGIDEVAKYTPNRKSTYFVPWGIHFSSDKLMDMYVLNFKEMSGIFFSLTIGTEQNFNTKKYSRSYV